MRFALRWFRALHAGATTSRRGRAHLPPPLSPLLMRGAPLDREARRRAGLSRRRSSTTLDAWQPRATRLGPEPRRRGRARARRGTPRRARRRARIARARARSSAAARARGDVVVDATRRRRAAGASAAARGARRRARSRARSARAPAARGAARSTCSGASTTARFCAALGQTLPGARYVRTLRRRSRRDRSRTVADRDRGCSSAPSAIAGRGRRRVRAGRSTRDAAWIERLARARGEGLQVEPWVERAARLRAARLPRARRRPQLGAAHARSACDARGAWARHRAVPPGARRRRARALCSTPPTRVAEALSARSATSGPSASTRSAARDARGALAFNPRCEINARYSMGWAIGMGDRRNSPTGRNDPIASRLRVRAQEVGQSPRPTPASAPPGGASHPRASRSSRRRRPGSLRSARRGPRPREARARRPSSPGSMRGPPCIRRASPSLARCRERRYATPPIAPPS